MDTDLKTEMAHARLGGAVSRNDFKEFNAASLELLNRFGSFREALADGPTDVGVRNAIFGQTGFYLKQTNDAQARNLLDNGRAASAVFAELPIRERLEFLSALEKKIDKHAREIGLVITVDTGKPVNLSAGEMKKGNEWFDYAYKEAERQLAPRNGKGQVLSAAPLGVAQVIGAYNYPYALEMGGVVGALAAGNGVIVSAPLKAPDWIFPFMQAAHEAADEYAADARRDGKPWADAFTSIAPKLIQYSVGVNRFLTAEADIVHFVGGDATGEMIRKGRGSKPTILEMGGSNVVAIMASAVEKTPGAAQKIAETLYEAFGPATGQRCTAPRMLCLQDGAEDVAQQLGKICDRGPGDTLGNPFIPGVKMGPLVDSGAHQKMQEAIALANEVGAVVHGQLKVNSNHVPQALNKDSFWVNPIVIDWRSADINEPRVQDCLKHEIFGPLLHILPQVRDLDGAIATTNRFDSHGLAGAIFTADPQDFERCQKKTRVTSLTVNAAPKDRSPWGSHGHPWLPTIGGEGHFRLYASSRVLAGEVPALVAA